MKAKRLLSTMLALGLALTLVAGMSAAQGRARRASAAPLDLMGTGFTYQGRLTDGGSPASGDYDFQFTLYGDGGAWLGTVDIEDQPVSDGLFTVRLDFGPNVLTGEARWLQIGVRPWDSEEAHTLLEPWQELTPAPYALALPGLWSQQLESWQPPNLIGGWSGNWVTDGVWGATIGGGGEDWAKNRVTDNLGTIAGGTDNQAGNDGGTIVDAELATVGGGASNTAGGAYSTIGGGIYNTASISSTTIGGGWGNNASGDGATVGGGGGNNASGAGATVGGGGDNIASGEYNATVSGGYGNTAGGTDATVGGGNGNSAAGWAATVSGGYTNTVTAGAGTIGGGESNTVAADQATVSGGKDNTIPSGGYAASICGGESNEASGYYATVAGGYSNTAEGNYSFAAGREAHAVYDGTFVWADDQGLVSDLSSTAPNQFLVRATGGVSFLTGDAPFLVNGSPVGGGSYANVVVVAKSGGDFTSIQDALDSITDASAANPYLVWIAPGVYAEMVTMKEYVDIEGSGELVTTITYAGSQTDSTGTVMGADNAELRFLTVENSGGDQYAVAILSLGKSPRLTHITASAFGAIQINYGILNGNGSSTAMNYVTATASGGNGATAITNRSASSTVLMHVAAIASGASGSNSGVSDVWSTSLTVNDATAIASGGSQNRGFDIQTSTQITLTNVIATASGGTDSIGLYAHESMATMNSVSAYASDATDDNTGIYLSSYATHIMTLNSVTASATGGGGSNYGMFDYGVSATLNNCTSLASGGTNNYGLYTMGGSESAYIVRINNSRLTGSTSTVRSHSKFTTLVGGTLLEGGVVVPNSGTLVCAGVYDENYTFHANTCP